MEQRKADYRTKKEDRYGSDSRYGSESKGSDSRYGSDSKSSDSRYGSQSKGSEGKTEIARYTDAKVSCNLKVDRDRILECVYHEGDREEFEEVGRIHKTEPFIEFYKDVYIIYKFEKLKVRGNKVYRMNSNKFAFSVVGIIHGIKPYDIEFYRTPIEKSIGNAEHKQLFDDLKQYNELPNPELAKSILDRKSIITEIFDDYYIRLNFLISFFKYIGVKDVNLTGTTVKLFIQMYEQQRIPNEEILLCLALFGQADLSNVNFGKTMLKMLNKDPINIFKFYPEKRQLRLDKYEVPLIIQLVFDNYQCLETFSELLEDKSEKDYFERYWCDYVEQSYYRDLLVENLNGENPIDIEFLKMIQYLSDKKLIDKKAKNLLFSMYKSTSNIEKLVKVFGDNEYTPVDLYTVEEVRIRVVPNFRCFAFSDNTQNIFILTKYHQLEFLGYSDGDMLYYMKKEVDHNILKLQFNSPNKELIDVTNYEKCLIQYNNTTVFELDNPGDDAVFEYRRAFGETRKEFVGVIYKDFPYKIEFISKLGDKYRADDNVYEKVGNDYKLIGRILEDEKYGTFLPLVEDYRFSEIIDDKYVYNSRGKTYDIVGYNFSSGPELFSDDPDFFFIEHMGKFERKEYLKQLDYESEKSCERKSKVEKKKYAAVPYEYKEEEEKSVSYDESDVFTELDKLVERVKNEDLTDAYIKKQINMILGKHRDDYVSRKELQHYRDLIEQIKVKKGKSEKYVSQYEEEYVDEAPSTSVSEGEPLEEQQVTKSGEQTSISALEPEPSISALEPEPSISAVETNEEEEENPTFTYKDIDYVYYKDEKYNQIYEVIDEEEGDLKLAGVIVSRNPFTVKFENGETVIIKQETKSLESSLAEEEAEEAEEANPEFNYNNNDYVYFNDVKYNQVYKILDRKDNKLELAGIVVKRNPFIIKFNNGKMIQINLDEEEEEEEDENPRFTYKGVQYVYYKDEKYNQVYRIVDEESGKLDIAGSILKRSPFTVKFNDGNIVEFGDSSLVEKEDVPEEDDEDEEANPEFIYKGEDYVYYEEPENIQVFKIINRDEGSFTEIGKVINRNPLRVEFKTGLIVEVSKDGIASEVVTKPTEVVKKPTEVVTKPTEVVKKPTEVVKEEKKENVEKKQNSDYYKSGEKKLVEYEAGEGKARRTYGYDENGNVFVKFRGSFVKDPVGKVKTYEPFEVDYFRLAKPKKDKEPPKYYKPGEIDVIEFTTGKGKLERTYGYDKEGQVFKMYRGNWEVKPVGRVVSRDPLEVEYFKEEPVEKEKSPEPEPAGSSKKQKAPIKAIKDEGVNWQDEYEHLEPITYKAEDYLVNYTSKHVFRATEDDEYDYIGNITSVKPLTIVFFEEEDDIEVKYGGLFTKNEKNQVFDKKSNMVGYWNGEEKEIHFIPLRAFLNESSSCYIDTVLFALLYRENPFILNRILNKNLSELFEEANVTKQDIKDAIIGNKNEIVRINKWLHNQSQTANSDFVCKPFRKSFKVIELDGKQSETHKKTFESGNGETNVFLNDLFSGFNIKTLVKTIKTTGVKADDTMKELREDSKVIPPIIQILPKTKLNEIFENTIEEDLEFKVVNLPEEEEVNMKNLKVVKKMEVIRALLIFLRDKSRVRKADKDKIHNRLITLHQQKSLGKDISDELEEIFKTLDSTIKPNERKEVDTILNASSSFVRTINDIDELNKKYSESYVKKIEETTYSFNEDNNEIDNNYLVLWVDRTLLEGKSIGKSKEAYDIQKNLKIEENRLDLQFVIKHIDSPKHFVCYFKNIKDGLWYNYDDVRGTFRIVKSGENIGTFDVMKAETQNDCVLLFYSK